MNNKYEGAAHQDKHIGVVWVACRLISWELVMPELDDRNFHGIIDVSEPIPFVINLELEDTKSPRSLQLVCISWRLFVGLLKGYLIIWIKHCKLELNILSIVWDPLTCFLLIDIDKVFNINLPLVVLRIVAVPFVAYFVVSHIINANHTSFTQVPLSHLCTQDIVWGALDG